MQIAKVKWFSVTSLKGNISIMPGKEVSDTLRERESAKLKSFSASLGNSKSKGLFSIIRKQHYNYYTFARRQIKNSTYWGNAKIKEFPVAV